MIDNLREITLELTNRCDLQCKICNIWKERKKRYIAFKDMERFIGTLEAPLTVSLTGGEPLLHPHFDRIYKYLYKLFLQKKIRNIDISTNAYSDKLINFLKSNKKYLQPLTLSISLDGLEKSHNKQRGKKDAFSKTLKNIIEIKKLNITPTIKFVITDINYKDMTKIHKLSKSLGLPFNPKPLEQINTYYHRHRSNDSTALSMKNFPFLLQSINEILKSVKRVKKDMSYFSLNCIKNFLSQGNLDFIKSCMTPQYSLFVTSDNKIYNCIYQKEISALDEWPKINRDIYSKIIQEAQAGRCLKCLSYHGYLREFNHERNKNNRR